MFPIKSETTGSEGEGTALTDLQQRINVKENTSSLSTVSSFNELFS